MTSWFEDALAYSLGSEGGYVNDPSDSGGATNMGITIATLSSWRCHAVTVDDVKALTRDEASLIYKALYWNPMKLDYVESKIICIAMFNAAILFGYATVVTFAQKALGGLGQPVRDDGIVGLKTTEALNTVDPKQFITEFHYRLTMYIGSVVGRHPKDQKFAKGWQSRVDQYRDLVA